MKKFKVTICALMLLSILITAVMLQFMPDIVPAHYNAAGEVDRLGSKYESLLFPAATAVMGGFFLLEDKLIPRGKKENDDKKVNVILFVSGILTMLLFVGMNIYFMGTGIAYGRSGSVSVPGIDIEQTNASVVILMGILLIILGNYMPKARLNALYGVRTKWSMANERIWQKSQRFGGVTSVICGVILLALSIFVKELLLLWMMVIILLWVTACITASYLYYRKTAHL